MLRNALFVIPLQFLVSYYLAQYWTCFDVACFCQMQTNRNALQVQDRLSGGRDTAAARWAKI